MSQSRKQDARAATAAAIMTRDVQTVHEDATIGEALDLMGDYGIGGLPVVDATGSCIGVFSAVDLVRRDRETAAGEAPARDGYYNFDPLADAVVYAEREDDIDQWPLAGLDKDAYDEAMLGRDTVGDWMRRDIKAVAPDATVAEVASLMVTERVHRVLVMEGERLAGIISTLDLVRVVAAQGSGGEPGDGGGGDGREGEGGDGRGDGRGAARPRPQRRGRPGPRGERRST